MLTVEKAKQVLTFDDVFSAINERFFVQSASTRNHWVIVKYNNKTFEVECDLKAGWVQVSEVVYCPALYSQYKHVGNFYRGSVEGVISRILTAE